MWLFIESSAAPFKILVLLFSLNHFVVRVYANRISQSAR